MSLEKCAIFLPPRVREVKTGEIISKDQFIRNQQTNSFHLSDRNYGFKPLTKKLEPPYTA